MNILAILLKSFDYNIYRIIIIEKLPISVFKKSTIMIKKSANYLDQAKFNSLLAQNK